MKLYDRIEALKRSERFKKDVDEYNRSKQLVDECNRAVLQAETMQRNKRKLPTGHSDEKQSREEADVLSYALDLEEEEFMETYKVSPSIDLDGPFDLEKVKGLIAGGSIVFPIRVKATPQEGDYFPIEIAPGATDDQIIECIRAIKECWKIPVKKRGKEPRKKRGKDYWGLKVKGLEGIEGKIVTHWNIYDRIKKDGKTLAQITHELYPQTVGKRSCDDSEANRCSQRVIRAFKHAESLLKQAEGCK